MVRNKCSERKKNERTRKGPVRQPPTGDGKRPRIQDGSETGKSACHDIEAEFSKKRPGRNSE